jgi:hypothetical protein
MAELTLADLVAWEPRLRVPGDGPLQMDRWAERELTWVGTARASAPMLPALRGGELVILPQRVVAESGLTLAALLEELAAREVVGVVLEAPPQEPSPIPVVLTNALTVDFEGDLNRLLTERRGEIYRTGTELSRQLTSLATAGADLTRILTAASDLLDVPIVVVDGQGAVVARSATEVTGNELPTVDGVKLVRGWYGEYLAMPLVHGETLWVGPAGRARRALIRVAGERLAVTVEAALVRAARERPRGPARASALAALLTGAVADAERLAVSIGVPVEGRYRVALAASNVSPQTLQRFLAPLGTVHDAGEIYGVPAAIVEVRAEAERAAPAHRRRLGSFARGALGNDAAWWAASPGQWIALSDLARGAISLPEAAHQARYAMALVEAGLVPGSVVRFDMLDDLGPYRLLYRLWGTADLATFISDALGDLLAQDRRGALRSTLLAYLDAGGSHVEAAARLGIHRNTLSYRLKQIEEFTGCSPDNPQRRLVLHLAVLAAGLPPAPETSG